jgi:hypothetical protein
MPLLGECLRRIAPAAAKVINFGYKHKITNKTQLLASYLTVDQSQNCINFEPQNRPSTQVINVTSYIKM